MSKRGVFVAGNGMTTFLKPSKSGPSYHQLAKEAGAAAMEDAGIKYEEVDHVVAGYCYGDSACGQRCVYELGMTGVPVINVNNNCATGGTALYLAKLLVQGGQSECVLVVGFEKMEAGSLAPKFPDRENPVERHFKEMARSVGGATKAPPTPQMFGNAAREHMRKYGSTERHLAQIAAKNHAHGRRNPRAQSRVAPSPEDVLSSPTIFAPLTKLQCCPTSDGAAAAVVCSASFLDRRPGLRASAVQMVGMALRTDRGGIAGKSCMDLVGFSMTRDAAAAAFAEAGMQRERVAVVELHDCFSANELISYEALGLCEPGGAAAMVERGDNTYGGRYVVNPSGGLIAKGHPLGATGLAQCAELCWQLKGRAGERQVERAAQAGSAALQHNIGLGGAAVVALYTRAAPGARL